MKWTNTPPSCTKRLLAALLALAMVLSVLPGSLVTSVLAQDADIPTDVGTGRVVYVDGAATGNNDGGSPENAFTTLEAAFAALSAGTGDAVIVICGTAEISASYNLDSTVTWGGTYYITGDYGTDYSDKAVIKFTNSKSTSINMGGKTHFSNLTLNLNGSANVIFYTAGGMTLGEGVNCALNAGTKTFSIYAGCYGKDYEGDVSIKLSSGKIGTVMGGTKDYAVKGNVDITVGGSADITSNITSAYKATTGNVSLTVNGGKINTIYAVGRASGTIGGDLTINLNAGTITQIVDHSGTGQSAKSVAVNLKPACEVGTFTALSSGRVTTTNGTTLNLLGYTGNLPSGILDCFTNVNVKDSSNATYTSTLGSTTAVVVESGSTLRLGGNESSTGLNVTGDGTVKYGMPVASTVYVDGVSGGDGSKDSPYSSLADAYASLDDEAGGTIVICGDTVWDGDYSGYGITGTVYITSKYSEDDYSTGDDAAQLILNGSNVTLSNSTNIDNVKVNVNASKMFLFTGMDLTIGSNVAMIPEETENELKVVCGRDGSTSTKGETINVSISSGRYHSIFMGNTNTVDTGSVNLTIGGTVDVWSNLQVSPNKGTAETLHFTMEGGDVNCIYNSGGTNGVETGNITIDLKSGTIKSMKQVGTKTPTTGNITVNLHGGFDYGTGTFGTWPNVTTGTRTLNLIGFEGTLATGAAANYHALTVKDASNVTYDGTLASGTVVTAETGSVLTLSGYTDQAAAEAAGLTVNGNKEGYGTVLFGSQTITYPEKVYINTDTSITERDGLTPGTGVATLQAAIQLLDPQHGGTIVLCSELVMDSDVNLEGYNVTGQVTLTSVDGGTDYRASGARLTWQGNKRSLITSGNTVITGLNFHLNSGAKESQFIYSGEYLLITDSVANTATSSGYLKIFVSKLNSAETDNCVAYVYGGTYNQLYIGSNGTTTGDATLYFGGNAFVTSNVACGPNSANGSVNNATFNMEGGYVKVIYDTSNSGSTVRGDLTLNLTGGTITEMRDYNGKSGMSVGGNITVNVDSQFNCGTGKFGVWSSSVVAVDGTKTLNLINYQGYDMNSLDIYDYVNIFSGNVPEGFVGSGAAGSLNIYDYSGVVGLTLNSFNTVTLTGEGSEITFLGEVPTSAEAPLALVANDGTTMYIRASANPNVVRADYAITENGTGKVVLDDPAYTGSEPVVKIDFDENTAGTVTGGTYGTSYNGTNALILSNKYGTEASDYLTITADDLKGLDISKDDFTVTMWYYGVYAGMSRWVGSGAATTAGAGIDMANNTTFGGMLLSNRDESSTANTGFSVAMLPQNQYMAVDITGQNGTHSTDSIRDASDAAWHQVAFTVDRSGYMTIYVDGAKMAAVRILEEDGIALGSNSLTIGADTLGQYGIGLSYFDDIAIYAEAIDQIDIMAQYAVQHLQGLTWEISQRVASVGPEYTDDMKAEITAMNEAAIAALETITFADYPTALSTAKALKAGFDAFLLAPEEDAGMVAIMFSDIHIKTNGDTTTLALETAIKDVLSNNLRIDTFINSGDLAEDSSSSAMNQTFSAYADLFAKHGLDWQMVACVGNHDTQYTSESACYNSSMPIYWENLEDYIGAMDADGNLDNSGKLYGNGKLVSVYQDSYSYLMEMDGYYYLVLNTENPGQTGDSSTYLNSDGSYSIEGNQYDPIRHGMWFSEGYLAWVEEMMALSGESGNPIFVVGHFPFIDSCPLSSYSEIVINDNSIGSQDAEIRSILCQYENVFYFCGHLHNSVSLGTPWEVSDGNGSFMEINLPAIKNSVRGYADIPTSWIMYVYEEEIVLRCRNYLTGEWLTQFDAHIPLTATESDGTHTTHIMTHKTASEGNCETAGTVEYWYCRICGKYFADENGETELSSITGSLGDHAPEKVEGQEPGELIGGYKEHYKCSICGKYFTDASAETETAWEELYLAPTGHEYHNYVEGENYTVTELMTAAGSQGSTIYGNTLVVSDNVGSVKMYDLTTGALVASFPLGSYNNGTLPSDANVAAGTEASNWKNHANQIMFGSQKFDESDPLPLLYVTTGNSGAHDGTGAYIAKCAVERILQDENGNWYSEVVQIIEFNDYDNIPQNTDPIWYNEYKNMNVNSQLDSVLIDMYDKETGKFLYVSDNEYDASAGYQKVGWGWPAWFVDSDPTSDTEGKLYIKSARFRTTEDFIWMNCIVYGIDPNAGYFTSMGGANAYIVTEFDLPELPASEDDPNYGATVTLYPEDITDQFETEYEVGVTQGGTLYQGRIYYAYGWNGTAEEYFTRNMIQVFDIAEEKIVATLPLYSNTELQPMEPECCSIWNGHLVLGLKDTNKDYQLYVFDYVALDDPAAADATCTESGCTYIECALCGYNLHTLSITDPAKGHTMTHHPAVDGDCVTPGTVAHWSCSVCGKNYADENGETELDSLTGSLGDHKLVKVERVEATVDAEGNIEHWECSVCGKLYDAEGKELSAEDVILDKLVPETSEPETSEPETSEPETSEPETSEPETSEPEASEPEASEPETSEPDTNPDASPDTGNSTALTAMAITMLLAAAGYATTVGCKKKIF